MAKVKLAERSENDQLTIRFKSKLDYGLVNKWVRVEKEGNYVNGTFVTTDDLSWTFVPDENLAAGSYQVIVNYKVGDFGTQQHESTL